MGEAPRRIQLSRAKGWRMPPNTVKVDRTTKWGNPHDWRAWREQWPFPRTVSGEVSRDDWCRQLAVMAFEEDLRDGTLVLPIHGLRGKNLACWCALHRNGEYVPCHADVLLELANPSSAEQTANSAPGMNTNISETGR